MKRDGVRAHGHPCIVLNGPQRGGHQISQRLAGPGPRLEHGDRSLVERVCHIHRHGQLAIALLEVRDGLRNLFEEEGADTLGIQPGDPAYARLDDPQCAPHLVVDNHHPDAIITVDLGELHVGL